MATTSLPKSPTFLGKVSKSLIFKWNHFWATFIDIWWIFTGHTAFDKPKEDLVEGAEIVEGRRDQCHKHSTGICVLILVVIEVSTIIENCTNLNCPTYAVQNFPKGTLL